MLRRFGLALLVIACLGGGAQAQTWEVPRAYAIPLPPMSEPRWELGTRFWASEGKTSWEANSSKNESGLGNPSSVLTYDDMDAYSGEFTWYARNETNTFAKGFVGGGGLSGGSLDDEDFLAGQEKNSDTYSQLDGDNLIYGTIDLGQRFVLMDGRTKLSVSPLIGFNFWQETALAYGIRCNPDDVPDQESLCGHPGELREPFSTKVIKNEANWASLRLGGEFRVKLWDRLTLIADAAILPVAYVWNDDSHFLRKNLGTVPNREDRGTGWGYQLEAAMHYDFSQNWSAGAGVRYWFAKADDGFIEADNTKTPMNEFTSERFGVFGDVTYRFATF